MRMSPLVIPTPFPGLGPTEEALYQQSKNQNPQCIMRKKPAYIMYTLNLDTLPVIWEEMGREGRDKRKINGRERSG